MNCIAKFHTNLRRARSSGVRLSNRLRFRGQPGSLGGSRRIAGLMSAIFCYFIVDGRVFLNSNLPLRITILH